MKMIEDAWKPQESRWVPTTPQDSKLHVSRLFVNRDFDLMYSNRSDLVLSDLKRAASGPIVLGFI